MKALFADHVQSVPPGVATPNRDHGDTVTLSVRNKNSLEAEIAHNGNANGKALMPIAAQHVPPNCKPGMLDSLCQPWLLQNIYTGACPYMQTLCPGFSILLLVLIVNHQN
jgi:hypothetical protein